MKIGNFDSLFEDHLEDAKIIAIPHQRDEEEMEEEGLKQTSLFDHELE